MLSPVLVPVLQYLVEQAAQRVLLVARGGLTPLEGGVAEYVQQLSSGGSSGGSKKKAGGSTAGAGSRGGCTGKGGEGRAGEGGNGSSGGGGQKQQPDMRKVATALRRQAVR